LTIISGKQLTFYGGCKMKNFWMLLLVLSFTSLFAEHIGIKTDTGMVRRQFELYYAGDTSRIMYVDSTDSILKPTALKYDKTTGKILNLTSDTATWSKKPIASAATAADSNVLTFHLADSTYRWMTRRQLQTVVDSVGVAGRVRHGVTPLHIAVAKDSFNWKTTGATMDTVYGDAFFPRNLYLGDTTSSGIMYYMGALGRISDVGYDSNAVLYGLSGTTRGPRLLMFGDQFWAYPGYHITSSGVNGGIILGSTKKGVTIEAQQQGRIVMSPGAGTVFLRGNRPSLPVGDTSEIPDTCLYVEVEDTVAEIKTVSVPLRLSGQDPDSGIVIDSSSTTINGKLVLKKAATVLTAPYFYVSGTGADSNAVKKLSADSIGLSGGLQDTLYRIPPPGVDFNLQGSGRLLGVYSAYGGAPVNINHVPISYNGTGYQSFNFMTGRVALSDDERCGSLGTYESQLLLRKCESPIAWTISHDGDNFSIGYTDTADAKDSTSLINDTTVLSISKSGVGIGSIDFPTSSKMYTDNQFHVATNGCKIKTNIPSDVNASVTLNVLGRGVFTPFNITAHFLLLRTPAVLLNKAAYGYGGPTKIYIYSEDGYVSFWFNREYTSPVYGGFAITLMSDSLNVNYVFTDTLKPSFASDSPLPDSVSIYDFRTQKVDTLSRATSLYEFASVQASGLTGSDRLKDSSDAIIIDGDSTWMRSSNVKMTGLSSASDDTVLTVNNGTVSKKPTTYYKGHTSGYLIKTDIKKTRATSMYIKIWGKHGASAVDCIASGYFDGTYLTNHRLNGAYEGIDTVFVTSRDSLEFWVAPQPSGAANLAMLSFSLTCDTTFKILNVKDSTYHHGSGSEYVFKVIPY
jgi:hypothetical protein